MHTDADLHDWQWQQINFDIITLFTIIFMMAGPSRTINYESNFLYTAPIVELISLLFP